MLNGLINGFSLHYEGPDQNRSANNLVSVRNNVEIAEAMVMKEVRLGRMGGPFSKAPFNSFIISPIGLAPKKDGTFRLIHHLSYPKGLSVNDFIDPDICSVQYSNFDQAMDIIARLGKGALMGKMDVKSAFRLLFLAESQFPLLGIQLAGKFYFDKCLPMGCSVSCATFEKFANFLQWVLETRVGVGGLLHYLDDFFFAGPYGTMVCRDQMHEFGRICSEFGVPIAEDKTFGPTQVLVFLGLELDSIEMVVRIPKEKLLDLRAKLEEILGKKKVTLKVLQQLTGLLNFCLKAIPSGRAFCRRFYDAMKSASKPHHFVRVTLGMREDLRLWLLFLDCFNGVCIIPSVDWATNEEINLFTDASGNGELGCSAYLHPHWIFFPWPESWANEAVLRDLTFLELVPIVMAFFAWGDRFVGKKILLHTDNLSLVSVLNKCTAKSVRVMQLVRPLVLKKMLLSCQFKAVHVFGYNNVLADSLSRKQFVRFQLLVPSARTKPDPVPEAFARLISQVNLLDC